MTRSPIELSAGQLNKDPALCQGVVPIVLGGLGEGDYLKLAPPNSYLHVDQFQGPHHLAAQVQPDCFFCNASSSSLYPFDPLSGWIVVA